ncbi:MAG TPA: hypothetical protein VHK06_07060 [Candidatus Limnocylindria bacterium]|nr:hypothetical protein [Candidatus Limnocylindria bacterium]
MRVIRPAATAASRRRRDVAVALVLLSAAAGAGLIAVATGRGGSIGLAVAAGVAGVVALGIGLAAAGRAASVDVRAHDAIDLERLLGSVFDDSYTLVVGPRLPGVPPDLEALLVGPAGVRALIARRWEGRYRARGRAWEFDAGGRGWIPCRTNPSFDAESVRDALDRWASSAGVGGTRIEATIAFPRRASRVVLQEPADEIVTADNTPWWAGRIGRVQRLDTGRAAAFLAAVLDDTERNAPRGLAAVPR